MLQTNPKTGNRKQNNTHEFQNPSTKILLYLMAIGQTVQSMSKAPRLMVEGLIRHLTLEVKTIYLTSAILTLFQSTFSSHLNNSVYSLLTHVPSGNISKGVASALLT